MSYSKVMKYFKDISAIPHVSGHTEGIQEYLQKFALYHSLDCKKDKVGNIVIYKKGTKDLQPLVLQAHMDMVGVADDKSVDMTRTPITLVEEETTLRANGTTLGADDGIGVAYMLALLDDDKLDCPPLECVFTVDEETGMDGAIGFDESMILGTRMINLDSEDEGEILSSSAGGAHILSNVAIKTTCKTLYPIEVRVSKITGGHSGQEINKRSANAIIVLRDILSSLKNVSFNLITFDSKNAYNVIPKEAQFTLGVTNEEERKVLKDEILDAFNKIRENYKKTDPDMTIDVQCPKEVGEIKCVDKKSFGLFIKYFSSFQNGVVECSKDDINKVITSLNTAVINVDLENNTIFIGASLRSNDDVKRDITALSYVTIARSLGGITTNINSVYPSWKEVPSPLRECMKSVYKKMYKKDMIEKSIHAGLECGYFAIKKKGMDIASIGPNVRNVHTSKEYADLESVKRVYSYLKRVIEEV